MISVSCPRRAEGVVDPSIPRCLVSLNGCRPAWLLTPYDSNTWKVTDTGNKPPRIIRFDVILHGGGTLADHPNLLDSIKRIVYGTRHGPLLRVESGVVQAQRASSLILLTRWMIRNGIYRFQDLTASDEWEYAELSSGGVHEILNTEATFSQYVRELSERAGFTDSDTDAMRREKSCRTLPVKHSRRGQVFLDRNKLFAAIGLGGAHATSVPPAVLRLIDELDVSSGLFVRQRVRQRVQESLYEDEVDEKRITSEAVRRLLMPFALLFEHRSYLEDSIQSRPFGGQDLKSVAKRLGGEIGRTRTIPVLQAVTLIERSVRWVLDYAPFILDAKDQLDQGKTPILAPADSGAYGPASPLPLLDRSTQHQPYCCGEMTRPETPQGGGMSIALALSYLVVACGIVIAAFSARRAAEIVGLQESCIVRDDSGNPWLRSFIHKTVQTHGVVPVPEVVASAVGVLERLSVRARSLNGTGFLFQYTLPGSDTIIGASRDGVSIFPLFRKMREFGYFVDVPPLADGSRWAFAPHQFRRFFAILYVWCYDLADWGALAYHLRHANLEQTRRYVSDSELGAILTRANQQRTADVLSSVALGNRRLSGPGGQRLNAAMDRLRSRLTQRVQIVSERKLQQRVLRFVERTNLKLKALPWGYCGTLTPDEPQSACHARIQGADRAPPTVSTCADCVRGIRAPEFRPYLEAALVRHRTVANSESASPLLRKASETLCDQLNEYLCSLGPAAGGQETLP